MTVPCKNPTLYDTRIGAKIAVGFTLEQYDALYAHCVATGTTMGAFCRERVMAAIEETEREARG